MATINITSTQLITFLLLFFRTAAVLMTAPLFGSQAIPVKIRILLPFVISIVLSMSLKGKIDLGSSVALIESQGMVGLSVAVVSEVILGIAIGFTARLAFVSLHMAGRLVGQEMGFGMMGMLDPSTRESMEIIGQYNTVVATIIFLAIRGHDFILMGIAKSFITIPLAEQWLTGAFIGKMNAVFVGIFETAFRIALPVMGALFLAKIAMGILARTMPQMNVFIVGFPLQIAVGLIGLAISLPFFVKILHTVFMSMRDDIWMLIGST